MDEKLYLNHELSWLEFNRRVLEEALDESVPLLERVKFLAIFSSNLDEFFMVRVALLKRRIEAGDKTPTPDGLTPAETLAAISERVHQLMEVQHQFFIETLKPLLAQARIRILQPDEIDSTQGRSLEEFFHQTLFPIVTPLAIDPGHPFPYLANRSLCLVVLLRPASSAKLLRTNISVVHIPAHVVPRFIPLPAASGQHAFILLEDVIGLHLKRLYTGYELLSWHALRVTRDAEFELRSGRIQDLLSSIEQGIRQRRMGQAVRLQYDSDFPAEVLSMFIEQLELEPADLYAGKGFTAFTDLHQLYNALNVPELRDKPLAPVPVPALDAAPDIWSAIRAGDVLIFHPYHSFDAVTRFVEEAARDPKVLAIKMTLYRVSPTSPIAQALRRAAEAGKEVAVLIELQARFDEEANISWARVLEEVGAHVVYGLVGYKTHCKACLVVRQESDGIRRYCHLATGNYNARTSGIYSDLGILTCRNSFGEDLTELFNFLTGNTQPQQLHHLILAPTALRDEIVARIRREAEHARAGQAGRIIAKLNSLVDSILVQELYAASQAGVQIDLLVRGICCLRPGLPRISERIRVTSIIDRYLEHARIFFFHNAGTPEYWLSSADWMPRNLDRRVEIAFPVLDPRLQSQLSDILEVQLSDTVKSWLLQSDGRSHRLRGEGAVAVRSQERLYETLQTMPLSAAAAADSSLPS